MRRFPRSTTYRHPSNGRSPGPLAIRLEDGHTRRLSLYPVGRCSVRTFYRRLRADLGASPTVAHELAGRYALDLAYRQ